MAKRILIVAQDEALRKSFLKTLLQEGYEVDEAADANDALRMMYEKRPQGVLLNLEVSGAMEILREKNESPLLVGVPFIVIAPPGHEKEVDFAREWGISSFLELDELTPRGFLQKINDVIGPPY